MTTYSKYDYSFFSPEGIDHRLMALYCARVITNSITSANTRDREVHLQDFISSVIHRSQLSVGVTIAGLILSRRFASLSNVSDARRVFLVGYMIAAKIMFDNDFSLVWWKRTVEREYDCSDLAKLEKSFYEVVGWNVQINADEFFEALNEAFTWYEGFIDEHTLPSSPLPTYQPTRERKSRLPASCLSLELAEEVQIEEDDVSGEAMALPLPCTAAVRQRPQGLTGMVFRFFDPVS